LGTTFHPKKTHPFSSEISTTFPKTKETASLALREAQPRESHVVNPAN